MSSQDDCGTAPDQDAPTTSAASPAAAALKQAVSAWEAGQLRQCLLAVSAAAGAAPSGDAGLARAQALQLRQLQALCRITLAAQEPVGSRGAGGARWLHLLLLDATATAPAVRAAFRRLSGLVHPDKCALPRAAQAFTELQQRVQGLLAALPGSPTRKRCRSAAGDSGDEPVAEDVDEEQSGAEEDALNDYGGFAWYSEWEEKGGEQEVNAADARAGKAASVAGCDAAADAAADAEADTRWLEGLGQDELRAEVQRRQAALLTSAGAHAALRRARSLLAASIAEAEACSRQQLDGGFLR